MAFMSSVPGLLGSLLAQGEGVLLTLLRAQGQGAEAVEGHHTHLFVKPRCPCPLLQIHVRLG